MKLSPEDAATFYRLMTALLFYANQQLLVISDLEDAEELMYWPATDKLALRDALFRKPDLIDGFLAAAGPALSSDDRDIVAGWRRFVAGEFLVERFLKAGTIFIDDRAPTKVYRVVGLHDSIEVALPPHRPPFQVIGVLLPFRGQIVIDGLLQVYSIFFGPGVRHRLREVYLGAKQRGRILTSLDEAPVPEPRARAADKPHRDWVPVLDEIVLAAAPLKGGASPAQAPAFSVLKASAALGQVAARTPDDLDALWDAAKKTNTALRRLWTVLQRADQLAREERSHER